MTKLLLVNPPILNDDINADDFLMIQNFVQSQLQDSEADEGTLIEFQLFKLESCETIAINGFEIYPSVATIEMYLYWAYIQDEILQEDLIDIQFEEVGEMSILLEATP